MQGHNINRRDFRVVLEHIPGDDTPPTGPPRQFVAVVGAEHLEGAQRAAAELVAQLKGQVKVVEISE